VSPAVVVLLLLAGLSEAAGNVLPVVAGRSGASRAGAAGLLLAGAVVDGAVIALWPLFAWTLAELTLPAVPAGAEMLVWTPGLLAPLLLAAVLAFPLLGPLLHAVLLTGVGVGLAGTLAGTAGIGWWAAAGCVAVAAAALGVTVAGVRRLVIRLHPIPAKETATPAKEIRT
jgi:hypothetical protein